MLIELYSLTDKQMLMAMNAYNYPVILKTRGQSVTAASLARHGYGDVEAGASGQSIFRLNQAGSDQVQFESLSWKDD